MEPIYWILVGWVGGFFTGKIMRFHTVNWHGAVDAVIGILAAVGGAAVYRGFGIAGSDITWTTVIVAFVSGVLGTFVCNELARTREEEVDEHVYADHHPEYGKLNAEWEERYLHVHNPLKDEVEPAEEEGAHIRTEGEDGERLRRLA
jgi:uncharacterized membrane protein YeaQ/YmgE (transglycosylase-associated protein family)